MRTSWTAIALALALVGCGGQSSASKQAQDAYEQALASCGTDDQAHSEALQQLVKLEQAHPKDSTVAGAFTKAYQYEAQHGC